jgi:glycosyltransferase involved in cell wall biosynthesis
MDKLKICYIIPRFHPFKGGAELNIQAMAERMAKKGHDVSVFTTNVKFRDEKPLKFEEYNGMKIYRHWALNESLYAGFYPGLLRSLWKSDFDVIHVSGFGFAWTEFCLIITKLFKRKTKFINTPHGPFMAFYNSGFKGFIKKVYTQYLSFIVPRLYDKVIAVVDKQDRWMMEDYKIQKEKIVVIPNGIDKKYIERSLQIHKPKDKVVITYLNRIAWYKGIQNVLSAMNLILKNKMVENTNFEFRIMGRPQPFLERVNALIQEYGLENYVKIILSPSDEERDQNFLESQINILPSKWEAFGIVLVEAMAKGNVIITTNQNQGVDMLIKEGESGYAYDFADVDKLASILAKLIDNFELRQAIIKHNHEFSKSFTWSAVFPKYEDTILELVNSNEQS